MKGVAPKRHKASFLQKLATPFSGRASPCISYREFFPESWDPGVKLIFSIASQSFTINGISTQIFFDLFLAFQLLKNNGVTLNEPIHFVPTSCVALVRPFAHIIIWIIIRTILNHRVQLTQRNMESYFFDPVQDITDHDLNKPFNF